MEKRKRLNDDDKEENKQKERRTYNFWRECLELLQQLQAFGVHLCLVCVPHQHRVMTQDVEQLAFLDESDALLAWDRAAPYVLLVAILHADFALFLCGGKGLS